MAYIKNHWFGIGVSLFVVLFILMLILILLAPKQDAKSRGFIPCTEKLVETLLDCERNVWCTSKAIINNSWCDVKVIGRGIKKWLQGKQAAPWSNYIFEPELPLPSFVDEEARQQYLSDNPDVKMEMERLNILRKELENEENAPTDNQEIWPKEASAGMGLE